MAKAEYWHYTAGWDYFTPDPGKWETCKCRACNAEMDVRRDCDGPTSSIMAMAKSTRKYDAFSCPNAGEPWHSQVIKLKGKINETPSRAIARLLILEVEEILRTRQPTKETGWVYGCEDFEEDQKRALGLVMPTVEELEECSMDPPQEWLEDRSWSDLG